MPYKCAFTYSESVQCTYYTALPVYLMNNEYGYYICKQRHKNYASRKSAVLIHYDIACRTCDTDVIRSFHKRCEVGQIKVESRIEQFSDIALKLYVPTDFDTKEKALSVAKAAEKGLK